MENRNETLKWLYTEMAHKIFVDSRIENFKDPIRGIYGIFISGENSKCECVYVGRSNDMYSRMFRAGGHMTQLMKKIHSNTKLNEAMRDSKEKIHIRILEEVSFEFDNYYKDMQRLASAENYYIDKYQSRNQCLEQIPEGTSMKKQKWDKMKEIVRKYM